VNPAVISVITVMIVSFTPLHLHYIETADPKRL